MRHRCPYRDIRLQLRFEKENVRPVFPNLCLPGWTDEAPAEVGEEEQGNRPRLTERDHTFEYDDGELVESTRFPEDRHQLSSHSERVLMMEHDLRENCLCMCCLSERWPPISMKACHFCEHVMVGGCCWWNDLRPVETSDPNDDIICVCCREYTEEGPHGPLVVPVVIPSTPDDQWSDADFNPFYFGLKQCKKFSVPKPVKDFRHLDGKPNNCSKMVAFKRGQVLRESDLIEDAHKKMPLVEQQPLSPRAKVRADRLWVKDLVVSPTICVSAQSDDNMQTRGQSLEKFGHGRERGLKPKKYTARLLRGTRDQCEVHSRGRERDINRNGYCARASDCDCGPSHKLTQAEGESYQPGSLQCGFVLVHTACTDACEHWQFCGARIWE